MWGGVSGDTVIMENSSDDKDHEVEDSFAMEQFDMVKTVGTGEELLVNSINNIISRHICQSMHVSTQTFIQIFCSENIILP